MSLQRWDLSKLNDWGPAYVTEEKSVIFIGRSSNNISSNVTKH